MKTVKFILFSLIILLGFSNCSRTQNSKEKKERFIELSVGDRVYVYDTLTNIIQNRSNYIYKVKESNPCPSFRVEESLSHQTLIDNLFSTERKKELKGTTLGVMLHCDSSGNVLEVQFRLKSFLSELSLVELMLIENALLKFKFEVSGACPERNFYLISFSYKGFC